MSTAGKDRNVHHITYAERIVIETMLRDGKNQSQIAEYLGFNRSSICREVKRGLYMHRNSDWTEIKRYSAYKAQNHADEEKLAHGKGLKVGSDISFCRFMTDLIKNKKYSPEAALKMAKRQHFDTNVCVKTVYRYIEDGVFLGLTVDDLPVRRKKRKRKQYKTQKRASAGQSIDMRDKVVLSRQDFGHWEMDTVKGMQGKTKGCLLVLTERKSRMEIVRYLPDQKAASVVRTLHQLSEDIKTAGLSFPELFKTITVDNGVEFSDYDGMRFDRSGRKRTQVYYCHAYSSWERGSNENNNRMIRRFAPKGTDLDDLTPEEVQFIEDWMNHYPRRMFGFRSSYDLFMDEIGQMRVSLAG